MHIIVNPASGKGAALRCLSAVTSYLTSRNIDYTIHKTNGRGHGKQLAESLCAATSGEPVVALGGDGTFHEVLNGMDFSRCRMGFIPAGRGNDYAAGVASITFNPIAAVAAIVRGEPAESDYIQVGNLRCLNICGTGLDVDVLELTERSHNALSYVVALAHCLLHYDRYSVQVAVNGTERE
ncbi:MAG: hypothetical protein IJ191_07430 [Treponema sp.]|nr:hypothetical protein [Treponema sp.]